MGIQARFPMFSWIVRTLTGNWARRILAALIFALLCFVVSLHIRSYLMVRRIDAVLRGLSEIRIDQNSESELQRKVPYLVRSEHEWTAGGVVQRGYYAEITNESDRLLPRIISFFPWGEQVAYWLGYRYINFNARAIVQDGKVQSISYGVSKQWTRPLQANIAARSVHGLWMPYSSGFRVRSQDDFSPQFRIEESNVSTALKREKGLAITFTNDAPSDQTRQAFQLTLDCFWRLSPCGDARDMAPQLWRTKEAIDAATYQELISEKCPDSIIQGRMKYLPDVSVLLLEVTGSRRLAVNEEGENVEDWFTDYSLKEVIRGSAGNQSWNHVRFRRGIPSPIEPKREVANQIWPPTKLGTQVLFFGTLSFDSCRFIPATTSALEIVRNTPRPTKRPEDQFVTGLL